MGGVFSFENFALMEDSATFVWPFQDVADDDDIWQPPPRALSAPRVRHETRYESDESCESYESDDGLYDGYDDWETYWDSIYG